MEVIKKDYNKTGIVVRRDDPVAYLERFARWTSFDGGMTKCRILAKAVKKGPWEIDFSEIEIREIEVKTLLSERASEHWDFLDFPVFCELLTRGRYDNDGYIIPKEWRGHKVCFPGTFFTPNDEDIRCCGKEKGTISVPYLLWYPGGVSSSYVWDYGTTNLLDDRGFHGNGWSRPPSKAPKSLVVATRRVI